MTITTLRAGTYHLSASYAGNSGYLHSVVPARKKLTVSRAPSVTRLVLSAAKIRYGQENSGRIRVTVAATHAGTPGGKVTVKSGKTKICVISLKPGKGRKPSKPGTGSCGLSARQLRAGSCKITAAYTGDRNFKPSTSAGKTLKVTG